MTDLGNILLDRHFDYRTISVENLRFGDSYTKIDFDKVADIYVDGETTVMNLHEKYDRLGFSNGYIHIEGLTLEISNAIIKSVSVADKYIRQVNFRNRKDIELEFGVADEVMSEGIMWGVGYSIEAKVLVYRTLKLYVHIDPETDELKKIHFGEVNEKMYD